MPIKAIFTRCNQDVWVDVAKYLQKNYDWKICYWIGKTEIKKRVIDSFPDIVYHDLFDAMRGLSTGRYTQTKLDPLDQEFLANFTVVESYALKMMDRMDPGDEFGYEDRINLYHNNLLYWKSLLQILSPDVVFFPTSPHHIHDYVLYALCQAMNLQTIVLARTNIPGLVLVMEQFEKGCEEVPELYEKQKNQMGNEPCILSQASDTYLKRLCGSYAKAMPIHTKFKQQRLKYSQKWNVRLRNKFIRLMELIIKGPPRDYLKHKNKHIADYQTSRLKWLAYKQRIKRTKQKLIKYYSAKSKKVDLNVPYIFVALQCQPERNTSPDGGMFAHQLVMIDLLSKIIPSGWYLYVKEHISQLTAYQRAESGRNFTFYDNILSLPNVKLASLSTTSFELIDHSIAAATVSGTVGFEAVSRGKPVFLFGHAWYKGCEGVFYTPTQKLCEQSLSVIKNGYTVDTEKVRLFVYVLEKCGFEGYIDDIYEKMSSIPKLQNAQSIAAAIGNYAISKLNQK
jgi:hypothetical protein